MPSIARYCQTILHLAQSNTSSVTLIQGAAQSGKTDLLCHMAAKLTQNNIHTMFICTSITRQRQCEQTITQKYKGVGKYLHCTLLKNFTLIHSQPSTILVDDTAFMKNSTVNMLNAITLASKKLLILAYDNTYATLADKQLPANIQATYTITLDDKRQVIQQVNKLFTCSFSTINKPNKTTKTPVCTVTQYKCTLDTLHANIRDRLYLAQPAPCIITTRDNVHDLTKSILSDVHDIRQPIQTCIPYTVSYTSNTRHMPVGVILTLGKPVPYKQTKVYKFAYKQHNTLITRLLQTRAIAPYNVTLSSGANTIILITPKQASVQNNYTHYIKQQLSLLGNITEPYTLLQPYAVITPTEYCNIRERKLLAIIKRSELTKTNMYKLLSCKPSKIILTMKD